VSLSDFMTTVIGGLAAERIPAMLTGSLAAAVRGASRATLDLDMVIDPAASALDRFVARMMEAGFYVSSDAAREALASRTMFNVIDPTSGWKADLIVRKERAFSESEFARRQPSELLGVAMAVVTVEDLILAKLEWATLGGSARQLEDVATLVRLTGESLDRTYLTHWIAVLGVHEAWARVPMAGPSVDST
jgi:hypothetical protein